MGKTQNYFLYFGEQADSVWYRITPWIDGMGTQNCFISAAFVGMAACAVFLVMVKWGKDFRIRSKAEYWALVQDGKEKGVAH